MTYDELKTLIEALGVHEALGPVGAGYGIEQNAHELATFLASLPEDVTTVLEIGSGYRAGLARFLHERMGMQVTSVDIVNYGHAFPGIDFQIGPDLHLAAAYDLVIIDGDHTYDAVKADYAAYGPLGRIVMFHDIAGLRDCEGVARLWEEISRTKKGNLRAGFQEVIAEGPYRAGIGWVNA